MAQKDKVKELVGRGLHSYHTKALQQVDRIEKKNKEQNHKISILSNELDNDYLTKTEEGSVVSLEHSKEGMIYLEELQGNTLVNYCTDGSKEMTLNGDIDVEGTFVTTTEGVDNGKVDVMCEGNTLVNLISNGEEKYSHSTDGNRIRKLNFSQPLKTGSLYTIKFKLDNINLGDGTYSDIYINTDTYYTDGTVGSPTINFGSHQKNGYIVSKITPNKDIEHFTIKIDLVRINTGQSMETSEIVLLEGDWTDKEIPSYFKGMKSVGELEDNKIEILSNNKNLFEGKTDNTSFKQDENGVLTCTSMSDSRPWGYDSSQYKFKLPKGTYSLRLEVLTPSTVVHSLLKVYDSNNKEYAFLGNDKLTTVGTHTRNFTITDNNNLGLMIKIYDGRYKIQIEKNTVSTDYVIPKFNKKEILLSEPLRSLPNGVCDEIIKQNGKWYVKRKLNETYIEVPSSGVTVDIIQDDKCRIIMADYPIDIKPKQITTTINVNCDKIPSLKQTDLDGTSPNYSYGISTRIATTKGIYMWVTKDKMPNQTLDGFKDFIKNNQPKIIYELETPIYEEIIDVELITYLDTTHISNNSIIPCNMKIKNSGYNAIIKPSTLYTVAIGTDKGGTIGMNLGGAKVTTTNNVAKITTPATLTDDSLRLYGKGRKGSKIRILEGDIINIPKHFTGIQSSFEDKVQTDGSYKIEVLSNNENLFRLEDLKYSTSAGNSARPIKNGFKIITDTVNYWHAVVSMELNVKPKTTYTLGVSKKVVINAYPNQEPSWGAGYVFIREYGDKVLTEGKVKDNTRTYFRFNSGENTKIRVTFATATDVTTQKGEYDFTDLDLRESKSNLEYVEHKSNKIQFLLDEPLRSLPNNVRDEITFKDNKLMIERNIGVKRLTSEDVTGYGATNSSNSNTKPNVKIIQFRLQNLKPSWGGLTTLCNKLKTGKIGKGDQTSIEHLYWGTEYNWIGCNSTSEPYVGMTIDKTLLLSDNIAGARQYIDNENIELIYQLAEPTYEEVPHELQKIILEGYENGTLFFDTNIPPTSTVRYAGETPIVKSVKLNKTEVLNNTEDINDNIIPYLMDMDYRVVMLQLATEELEGGVSMARLFGGTYEMIKRDILSKRLTREEYGYRLADYFNAGKLTEEQVRELEELR